MVRCSLISRLFHFISFLHHISHRQQCNFIYQYLHKWCTAYISDKNCDVQPNNNNGTRHCRPYHTLHCGVLPPGMMLEPLRIILKFTTIVVNHFLVV